MDWSNERYVRLYTRDTADVLAIGWQGRFVLYELLRKVDRAGVIETGGDNAILGEILRIPADICARGIEKLAERKVIEVTSTAIVVPNFIEAQETPQSDRARQRSSRETRRDKARLESVTNRDQSSQNVTKPSRAVTPCHTLSRDVTPCLAEPSQTIPLPSEEGAARGGAGGSTQWPLKLPLANGSSTPPDAVAAPPKSEAKPKRTRQVPETDPRVIPVIERFGELFVAKFGEPYPPNWGRDGRVIKGLPSAYTTERLFELLARFFADPDPYVWQKRGITVSVFVERIPALLGQESAGTNAGRDPRRGRAEPMPATAFRDGDVLAGKGGVNG